MPVAERNWVFFRFFSDATLDRFEFHGREISIGDLKQGIAEKKDLPRFDLVLVNEATNVEYTRDGAMLPRNTSVIVRRTPPQNPKKHAVVHLVATDIWSQEAVIDIPDDDEDQKKAPIVKRPIHPEYLCSLCQNLYVKPRIAKCCGRSACEACFEPHLECPLCQQEWDMGHLEETVPNQQLAGTVAKLNMDYFELPGEAKPLLALEDGVKPEGAKLELKNEPSVSSTASAAASSCPPALDHAPIPEARMLPPEEFYAWQQALINDEALKERERAKKQRKLEKQKRKEEKRAKEKEPRKLEIGEDLEERKKRKTHEAELINDMRFQ